MNSHHTPKDLTLPFGHPSPVGEGAAVRGSWQRGIAEGFHPLMVLPGSMTFVLQNRLSIFRN